MAERPRFMVIADDDASGVCGALPDDCDTTLLLLGADAATSALAVPKVIRRVIGLPSLDWSLPTDAIGVALAGLIQEASVVVMDSSQPARDLAGWLAAHTGCPVAWAIESIRTDADGSLLFDRVVLGGTHRLVHTIDDASITPGETPGPPAIVLVKPVTAARSRTAGDDSAEIEIQSSIVPGPTRVRVLDRRPAREDDVPLSGARIVVAIGRGIGGPDNVPLFRELARHLGAGFGASRVAVDAGWVSFAHQIGQTGAAVAPEIYLAFGISGAIQHLAGMRGSRAVVAINTDPDAAICGLSDLVVEGDAVEVAEGLLKRLLNRS